MRRTTTAVNKVSFLLCSALIVTSCADEADAQTDRIDPLLASELVYLDEGEGLSIGYELDPWLSKFPQVARMIIDSKKESLSKEICTDGSTCWVFSEIKLHNQNNRLVSIVDVTNSFHGGAHGSMKSSSTTFDTKTGERLRFEDIFEPWQAARALLQSQWCEAVSRHSLCPPIENQALALSGSDIFVQTSDYAFGSYAEGSERAYLPITTELIALAKPEYQSSFSLPEDEFAY
ncbi:hypothetical protein GRI38_13820 [Altererythrobacter aurantiacus]|uniref:Deacetylase PdaC domain-containing protein n=1 Tax=Parapontixanthobacter aurantiacus TaxID=1463599 RepID=A0A844ZIY2_9SPHN|nr:DUF4163 domain-containing protein [Parapontixanthobacter aurantiacus]MXO87106.1 hypothetical protein [Parapontixanthobacter aurantiacus]